MSCVAVTSMLSGKQSSKDRSALDVTVMLSFFTEFIFITQSGVGVNVEMFRERPSVLLRSTLHDTGGGGSNRKKHKVSFIELSFGSEKCARTTNVIRQTLEEVLSWKCISAVIHD